MPALVGCKICYFEPADVIWHVGGTIGFWGDATAEGQGEKDIAGRFTGVRATHMVSGSVMLIPRAILDKVGGQDDRYFFAIDDIEYSARVERAGFELKVNLDAVVWHKVSRSMRDKRPLALYYQIRNVLIWRREYFAFWSNVLFTVYHLPRWFAEFAYRLLRGKWTSSKGMLYGFWDFVRGTYGECPHLWMNPSYRRE